MSLAPVLLAVKSSPVTVNPRDWGPPLGSLIGIELPVLLFCERLFCERSVVDKISVRPISDIGPVGGGGGGGGGFEIVGEAVGALIAEAVGGTAVGFPFYLLSLDNV